MAGSSRDVAESLRVPDLRLAGFTVGLWSAALGSLHLSAAWGLAVGVVGLATAAGLIGLGRAGSLGRAGPFEWAGLFGRAELAGRVGFVGRAGIDGRAGPGGRWWAGAVRWIGVAVALGVGCGAVATAARVSVREAPALAGLVGAGATVQVEVVIRDDPRLLAVSAGPPTYLVAVDLESVTAENAAPVRLSARALVLGADPGWRGLLPGQRVAASGRLMPPRPGDLRAAVLSARKPPRLLGRPSWAQRGAGVLRTGLQLACEPLPDDSGGLLPGLVVGDTSRLDPALEEDFRTTGLTHLTAVSGTNVAIVLGVVLFVVRRARAGPVLCAVLCAVALVAFVILARPSPSVIRAGAMGAIGLLGLATGRSRAAVPALAAGAAVLLIADPELAADAGFALSVMATAGLLLIAPVWRDGLRRRGCPAGVAEALAVPAAAQIACGPVVAAISGTVSLVAVPANLVAVPAIAPATLSGVASAVLSPLWPAGAEFAAWVGHWPTEWLVLVAHTGAGVPAGALPWPGGAFGGVLLAVLTVVFLVAARRVVVRRVAIVVALGAILGALPVRLLAPGWPPPGWLVVACAVGQGDAVVLAAGAGRAVVVDAGPEPDAVDRCLRRLGVEQVAVLVVSHFHADHIGGVTGVFRGRKVDAVIGPDWPEPASGRAAVEKAAAASGTAVQSVGPGWSWAVGGLSLEVLGPVTPMRGTNSDPNNNSLILRAVGAGRSVLLLGDAETEEQEDLVTVLGPAGLRADVLKVAHHGSALQATSLVDAVQPAVALVSVGRDNDYGHPNAMLLGRIAQGGARVLRTDESGDVAAVVTGGGLAVAARGADGDTPG
ncbi:ComEC/Rec2 family competence protein [Actinoplanes xinjiangensis]|uniref:Competence protein ComEC n=1 Tax=Actinoplanes xinjiangensis TaxID=512350 RepID=A0A316FNV5_9ACTN|nr:ComEC/Rec2 family competence protein [Actinoplanes xinjiangensis]PWK49366.1 competence protein ComEC [Actinoplanes xinjiangensis]GIF37367.1 competence protein ComEC [Actinoplanes xinjiangensis]